MTGPVNPPSVVAELHPTVLSALQNTAAGPYLGQPAQQVLSAIGLPTLPQVPAVSPFPGVPPLPQLDPATLVKPITDLFGGFGTGNLGAGKELNPQTVLSNVGRALNVAMQLGATGLGLLQLLEGQGAQSATTGATATQASSAAVGTQATRMNTGVGAASTTVSVGAAQMSAVIEKFVTTTVALGPALATPPGQIAMLANGVDTGVEATAVTANTKAQLAVHAANMTTAGSPVPVSGSGLNSNLGSQLQQLASIGQGVASAGQKGAQALAQPISQKVSTPEVTAAASGAPAESLGVAEAFGAAGGALGTDAVAPAQRLSSWQGDTVAQTVETSEAVTPASEVSTASEAMMPPWLGGAAMSKPAAAMSYTTSPSLINAAHSKQLTGTPDVGLPAPVVGAAEYEFGTPEAGSGP
jgi:hypothetical protein